MEKRGRGDREGSALKSIAIVLGGLALSWLTMETAFKPFLDRMRGTIRRSDPDHDSDSDNEGKENDGEKGVESSDKIGV